MKREEREKQIQALRDAGERAHRADLQIEALTRHRERVNRYVTELLEGHSYPIGSVGDVPRAMRAVWSQTEDEFPDVEAVRSTPEFAAASAEFGAAMQLVYAPEFMKSVERLRKRHASGVEPALVFLQADPHCFRSGYLKQDLVRYLRRVPLTREQQQHLRGALLTAVRAGGRPEFRDYCRTARIVDTPRFRRVLRDIREDETGDPGARQCAGWMLDAIMRTNGE